MYKRQPLNTTVCTNGNAIISINASGTGITYQWQVNSGAGFSNVANGGVYTGATTATLGISVAPISMNGYTYRCIVSGTCPSALTSNTITLTVPVSYTHLDVYKRQAIHTAV